jgi:hypothetical protein
LLEVGGVVGSWWVWVRVVVGYLVGDCTVAVGKWWEG